jgi:hypothetical protein
MEKVPKIHSSLISTGKSGKKVLMMKRLLFYGLVLSFSILMSPMTASAYSGNIYLSSFQNIDWTINLTGEIYYNFGSGPGSPTYYSYCVDRSTNMPVPGSYYAVSQSIAGNTTGLLQAAWLIDNYAASKPYTYPGSTPLETGVALQLAIWDQIGQSLNTSSPTYAGYQNLITMENYFDNQVNQVSAGTLSSLASKYQVLKIYVSDGSGQLQSIETLTPVPIPAAFMLFGPGLLGLLGMRRKITLPTI